MQVFELSASVRTLKGKGPAFRTRQAKMIPAIYYGKGKENIMISVDPKSLEKAISGDAGMNTMINLKVEGKGDFNVLLKDYQAHALTRVFTHADFMYIDLTKKITVSIPVHLTGIPQGVKDGGVLQQATREIEVLCLPTNIPKEITADVSELKVGQNLHMHDLKLPEGVEVDSELDVTIASVLATREEVVDATPGVMAEPEVLTAKAVAGEAAPAGDKKADAKK